MSLAGEDFCYITTTGRVTGHPHKIEIWFGMNGSTIYMLAGGGLRSDWPQNIARHPQVQVRIGDREFEGRGRIVDDPQEDALARRLLPEKYQAGYGEDLSEWAREALPVAIDLEPA